MSRRGQYHCSHCKRRLGIVRKIAILCFFTPDSDVAPEHIAYEMERGDLRVTCPGCGTVNTIRARVVI